MESLKLYKSDFESHILQEWQDGKMKSYNDKVRMQMKEQARINLN